MTQFLARYLTTGPGAATIRELRTARFAHFRALLGQLSPPLHILDIGGLESFWRHVGYADLPGVEIVLLNLQPQPITRGNATSWLGDTRSRSACGRKASTIPA